MPVDGIDYQAQLEALLEQIRAKGVRDARVLEAIRQTPRHLFVPESHRHYAYIDHALPIGEGQTISQPSLVAQMTQLLELQGDENVLEIGTGSGYQTAILRRLCTRLTTIERFPRLALQAYRNLQQLDLPPITFVIGDGTCGFPPYAPYDRILVTAGAPPKVPQPLLDQLSPNGGKLLLPVGSRQYQVLTRITKHGQRIRSKTFGECVFVPLVGKYGWKPDEVDGWHTL
ncbi:MAG: protein-L-isoaspartate(D-aspartate) O-methyltransferase [Fimbriimonadales bacterium]|nr:protein-L-isoaspartate(D-aspartate) O-methyltransferase [Fimbriimonadales bacterium]MDW8052445.1 protein-L-isoaspartate(D-aspartate) O-methyltransferase [Armatimonadota bacterium]